MELLSPLVRNLVHPLQLWRRGDLNQLRYVREYEATQFYTEEGLRDLQLGRLRVLLEFASRHVPFYRRRLAQAGFQPGDLRTLEDLCALPPLEKAEVQRHRAELTSAGWPEDDLVLNQTGGSSGTPVSFYVSRERMRSRAAATVRHNRWAGWDVGDRAALLWGAPRDQPGGRLAAARAWFLDRQMFLDTGHVTEERLLDYHRRLLRFRPKVILAYARSAVLFARFLQARGLEAYRPCSLVTSAEVLAPEERLLLESVFGCPVFNRYGSREVSVIASECDAHQGLHVMAEGLYVEVVRGDRLAGAGELGAVLVTDLLNFAMPLIRYRIGDAASWVAGRCPCGRGLPRLREVAGRVTDFLVGADGRAVSGAFLTIAVVAKRVSLGQVQIHQERAGEVLYRVKPGPGFSPADDLEYLIRATREHLGDGTAVRWELVEHLPVSASGKYLFSTSSVTPEFLRPRGGVHEMS